jgi:hypothetical protein
MSSRSFDIPFPEFAAQFGAKKRFWRTLKGSVVPFGSAEQSILESRQKTYIQDLYSDVVSGRFFPQPPREVLLLEKDNGVPRFIHALSLQDACIYYFCMLHLREDVLAGRIQNTFAGWTRGGGIRQLEQVDLQTLSEQYPVTDPQYASSQALNPIHYIKIWGEYRTAVVLAANSGEYHYFVHIDIANFFDNIDLSLLERLLRTSVQREKQTTVDLLFAFLSRWNRTGGNYNPTTVGLPVEEIGDSSRLFANFYLQTYDRAMFDRCKTYGEEAAYFRYADDQWIMAADERMANELVVFAAEQLQALGLSINVGKVLRFDSRDDLLFYWGQRIFEPLEQADEPDISEFAVRAFEQFHLDDSNQKTRPWRRHTVEHALQERVGSQQLDIEIKAEIVRMSVSSSRAGHLTERLMTKMYRNLGQELQCEFIQGLERHRQESLFSYFDFHHDRFRRGIGR